MFKKAKAFFGFLLAIVVITGTSACSGSVSQQPAASATPQSPASGSTQQSTASSKPAKNVDLVVWFPNAGGDTSSPVRAKLNSDFQAQHPGVKIDEVVQPNDNYDELIKAANLAGNGPDVLELWPGTGTTEYAKFLVPLNTYLDDSYIKNYFGWNLARVGFGDSGDICGIPFGAYVYTILFNKQMMAKVGVNETNFPKTWDDLMTVCEKLKQQNIVPFCIGTKDGYMVQWGVGSLLCTTMGNDGLKLASPDYKFTGSEVQKGIEVWQEIGKRGYIIKDTSSISTGDDQDQRFVAGGGAMLVSGNWEMYALQGAMKDNLGVGKFPCVDPSNTNKNFNYAGPGLNFCVTKYSKNIDSAIDYIKALNSPEYQVAECNERGDLPTCLSVDPNLITNPMSKQFYTMLKSGQNAVNFDVMNMDAFNELVRMGAPLTLGTMSAKDICEDMDKIIAKDKAK